MRYLASLVVLLLVACSDDSPTPATTAAPAPEPVPEISETERLNAWLDEQFEEQLDFNPQTRSILGSRTGYDRLTDRSLEAGERSLQWLQESVATMEADFDYEALTEDGKLSYDMWAFSLQQAERAAPYRNYGYIFGRGGPQSSLPSFMISFHRVETEEDLQAYISRLRDFDRVIG